MNSMYHHAKYERTLSEGSDIMQNKWIILKSKIYSTDQGQITKMKYTHSQNVWFYDMW